MRSIWCAGPNSVEHHRRIYDSDYAEGPVLAVKIDGRSGVVNENTLYKWTSQR